MSSTLVRPLRILAHTHARRDRVLIHSRGGIGNQLFILAAGLATADRLGCRLEVDPSQHAFTPRLPFLIPELISRGPRELEASLDLLDVPKNPLGRVLLGVSIPRRCAFDEGAFSYNSEFDRITRGTCLFGYFQSWRYLGFLSAVRRVQLRAAIDHQAPLATWGASDIVVHVRRGDYLENGVRQVHGVLSQEYYRRAIAQLRGLGYDGTVWVVAEDRLDDMPQWHSDVDQSVRQVVGATMWQDLSLLVAAPSLVIANSTFSWMGGWLGDMSRPVVAPNPWFATEALGTPDLIPPQWHQINHGF